MSLDCYPLGRRRTLDLIEQPLAVDVAYNDDLFAFVTDQCQSIAIYDLSAEDGNHEVRKFPIGKDVVVDQIVYCPTGDYLTCVGHKEGLLFVYTLFNWRPDGDQEPQVLELSETIELETNNKINKLNHIDCCRETGNLALSCGDLIVIYKYIGDDDEQEERSEPDIDEGEQSFHSQAETIINTSIASDHTKDDDQAVEQKFRHIITIKLSIWALKICLLENYLSITAVDHVQVLKLELLTLQIQSEGLDFVSPTDASHGQLNNWPTNGTQSETTSINSTTIATTTTNTNSMISEFNSTTTDFSTNNNNVSDQLNSSDISIITMNQYSQQQDLELAINPELNQHADDCITWNLNTKKLVKLPTLMHNTSTNLSSYDVCHPLELLGPASESIACRVDAAIQSSEFSLNQLEAVVMLCKHFIFEKDPVKMTQLQAIYLANQDARRRLTRSTIHTELEGAQSDSANADEKETSLLKSTRYDLLASITCFVCTLSSCFVYSLHGKKVIRTQVINHPDLCIDLRPDLLNAYLLTPVGLQILSTGICDSVFRYDWSSSADLNLSFIATDRSRVLTSSKYLILLGSSVNGKCIVEYLEKPSLSALFDRIVHTVNRCNSISIRTNMLTYLHAMAQLARKSCGIQVADSCETFEQDDESRENDNILRLVTIMLCKQLLHKKQSNIIMNSRIDKAIKHLLDISKCDLIELMKRHLKLPTSLAGKRNRSQLGAFSSISSRESADDSQELRDENRNRLANNWELSTRDRWESIDIALNCLLMGDDDKPLDSDHELIKIYLKYAKFNQSLLDYLVANPDDRNLITKLIVYTSEYNPRLLIKCAQRYPLSMGEDATYSPDTSFYIQLLIEKLKQLIEFDSTGINRATVLFTLAILYNAQNERQKCLASLGQIKPLNHLAITMSLNYELSHSIAVVVRENYPDVFNLFLIQLAKRDKAAANQFSLCQNSANLLATVSEEDANSDTMTAFNNCRLTADEQLEDDEDADDDLLEKKVKSIGEIASNELIDLFSARDNNNVN